MESATVGFGNYFFVLSVTLFCILNAHSAEYSHSRTMLGLSGYRRLPEWVTPEEEASRQQPSPRLSEAIPIPLPQNLQRI